MRPCLAALLSLLPLAAASGQTRFAPLWVEDPRPAMAAPACRLLGLLNLPPGWQAGDAAAVRLSDNGAPPDPAGERLTTALLDAGTAVLEVATGGACGDEPAVAREPLADLFGGLRALRQEARAGIVLAVGLGAVGAEALAATDPARAAAHLGPGGEGFAVGVAVGAPDGPAIRRGQAPAAAEGWAMRSLLLCELLGRVAAAGGPGGAVPDREACRAALTEAAPATARVPSMTRRMTSGGR